MIHQFNSLREITLEGDKWREENFCMNPYYVYLKSDTICWGLVEEYIFTNWVLLDIIDTRVLRYKRCDENEWTWVIASSENIRTDCPDYVG
ncbi:MAG: hypothetical protein ACTSUO_08205 [Candidatus Thorarchaeota archaeon]